jgi:hypothetical protein
MFASVNLCIDHWTGNELIVGLTLLKFKYSTYGVRSSVVDEQSQFIARADWFDPEAGSTERD